MVSYLAAAEYDIVCDGIVEITTGEKFGGPMVTKKLCYENNCESDIITFIVNYYPLLAVGLISKIFPERDVYV